MDAFSGFGDGCEESGVGVLGDDGFEGGVGVSCPGDVDGRGVGVAFGDVGVDFGDGDGGEDPQFCLLQFTW